MVFMTSNELYWMQILKVGNFKLKEWDLSEGKEIEKKDLGVIFLILSQLVNLELSIIRNLIINLMDGTYEQR